MNIQQVTQEFFVSGQISADHIEALAQHGIKSIVCSRPDGEEIGQPTFEVLRIAAETAGIEMRHVPVSPKYMGSEDVIAFRDAMQALPMPMLGYCRTGMRAAKLFGAVTQSAS